jgi:hypothetical protein
MRALFIATVVALSLPFTALAKVHPIPDEDPIATITLPDNWDVDDLDDGIEVASPDDSVYLAIEALDLVDSKAAMAEAFKFFDKKGITVDNSSQKQNEFTVNGLGAFELGFKGRDEDGPTNVKITVIMVGPAKALMVTYWASDEGEKNLSGEMSNIIGSVQAAKK